MHAPTMHCKLGSIYINEDIPLATRKDAPQGGKPGLVLMAKKGALATNETASWRCSFSLTCLGDISGYNSALAYSDCHPGPT